MAGVSPPIFCPCRESVPPMAGVSPPIFCPCRESVPSTFSTGGSQSPLLAGVSPPIFCPCRESVPLFFMALVWKKFCGDRFVGFYHFRIKFGSGGNNEFGIHQFAALLKVNELFNFEIQDDIPSFHLL